MASRRAQARLTMSLMSPMLSGLCREASSAVIPRSHVPVDGGGVRAYDTAQLGGLSPTREVAADVRCGIGSWGAPGGRCLRMAHYVTGPAATRHGPAAGGR